MNLQGHHFSQNANQKFEEFRPGSLLEGVAEILQIFGRPSDS